MGVGEYPSGTFRFKKIDGSFWNGETFRFADYKFNLGLFQKNIENGKSAFVSDLFEQAKTQDVIKYCMQNNYRFHYIYTDKNSDILYILEIEPEDYNK